MSRAATSFYTPTPRSYKQKAAASNAARRLCAAGSATLGSGAAIVHTAGNAHALGERGRGHMRRFVVHLAQKGCVWFVPTPALMPSQISGMKRSFMGGNATTAVYPRFGASGEAAGAAVCAAEQLCCCICPHGMQRVHAAHRRAAANSGPHVGISAAAAAQTQWKHQKRS